MDTATAKGIRDRELVLSEHRLNESIASFIRDWAPKDEYEASYFNAQFHSIVRAVYADMQKPVTKCLENVLMVTAPNGMIFNPSPAHRGG